MYVHPLYCLSPRSKSNRGFSVGSDTHMQLFDLQDLLLPQISRWSPTIFNTLAKDGMFPAGTEGDVIAKQGYCCGYELLKKLVRRYLPNYTAMPAKLLTNRPKQQRGETIQQYSDWYDDYANLCAILENISTNLCDTNKLDNFIIGLLYSEQYV